MFLFILQSKPAGGDDHLKQIGNQQQAVAIPWCGHNRQYDPCAQNLAHGQVSDSILVVALPTMGLVRSLALAMDCA